MFQKTPLCEVCHQQPVISFSYFEAGNSKGVLGWFFTCICTDEAEHYYIKLDKFFSCPGATVDWLAHMNEKTWMDWSNFMSMIERFREATDAITKPDCSPNNEPQRSNQALQPTFARLVFLLFDDLQH